MLSHLLFVLHSVVIAIVIMAVLFVRVHVEPENSKTILTSTFGLKLPNCFLYELHDKNMASFKSTDLSKKRLF